MRLNDPALVRAEYASEVGLAGRRAAYFNHPTTGPQSLDIALAALAEVAPRRVLEVGSGFGEFAARVARELQVDVIAVDLSPRMVELARERGVDARLADVQQLPFADNAFDSAVAAWMLYHVPDVERAVAELARVLRPSGRLVAITNALDHLHELRALVGLPPRDATPFSAENGEKLLRTSFSRVATYDAGGTIVFPDREAVLDYVRASRSLSGAEGEVARFDGAFVATRHPVVFVADKA